VTGSELDCSDAALVKGSCVSQLPVKQMQSRLERKGREQGLWTGGVACWMETFGTRVVKICTIPRFKPHIGLGKDETLGAVTNSRDLCSAAAVSLQFPGACDKLT
jgi:hypothetical protein